MNVLYPPQPIDKISNFSIFLAGTIEMGNSHDWQQDVINELSAYDITILSPRRKDYDPTWVQDISNPPFAAQVNWELQGLNNVDVVMMYFDPTSKSPISLLELGLLAGTNISTIVVCPEGFWRRGNVQIMCHNYNFPLVNTLTEAIESIKYLLLKG